MLVLQSIIGILELDNLFIGYCCLFLYVMGNWNCELITIITYFELFLFLFLFC